MEQKIDTSNATPVFRDEYQAALDDLTAAKHDWAKMPVKQRIELLEKVKDETLAVADAWVDAAARAKLIPQGSPIAGEEWFAGPYALMSACNGLIKTFSKMEDKAFVDGLSTRELPSGQTSVKVLPQNIWEHLLLSGVKAEVWMEPGVDAANLKDHTAGIYDIPADERVGKLALVLGAGNIAAIPPLDVFQKLFNENQVVLLKMNPVNEYLAEFFEKALKPLIEVNALRVVKGDGMAGAWLTSHPQVEEIHVTGAGATHDAIVWGVGAEGAENKAAGTPKNARPITSELGAVCPTIVVPGPWTSADIKFQAEQIATQKMHNSGFNCVACQILILPAAWDKGKALMSNLKAVIGKSTRPAYYPKTDARLDAFRGATPETGEIARGDAAPACLINSADADPSLRNTEVFAPALSTHEVMAGDAESYLVKAVEYANSQLYGTLGANIVIHPRTIREIGRARFEEILADLKYGCIAVNAWTGVGFMSTATTWGAFPGHTIEDVQSGIGTVHNTFLFDKPERTVVEAPFRPFPRNVLSGGVSMLPRPPWFITNTQQHIVGKLLTRFMHKPGWLKLPRIFLHALRG